MDLPNELLSDILSRLPSIDLIRFKNVCKRWRVLNYDHKFADLWLTRRQPEIIFTTGCQRSSGIYGRAIDFEFDHWSINLQEKGMNLAKNFAVRNDLRRMLFLLASCNGLLLVRHRNSYGVLYVCNPVTRTCKALPQPKYKYWNWNSVRDDSSGKYKVFGVSMSENICLILTLGGETCVWVELNIGGKLKFDASPLVLGKKELHWTEARVGDTSRYICSINIANLKVRQRAKVPTNLKYTYLAEVNGTLCLTRAAGFELETWVLNDRIENSWTKAYSFSLKSLSNISADLGDSFVKDSEVRILFDTTRDSHYDDLLQLMKILILHKDQLLFYDMKSQESRWIGIMKNHMMFEPCMFHTSSFVSW